MTSATEPLIAWKPNPGPQSMLLDCPIEDVLYGGARFGGKTDGLLGDFAQHAGQYGKDARGIFFRRTLHPELEDVIRRSREIYGPCGWTYNANEHEWTAPNGASLRLRYLENDGDAGLYIGHAYTWMAVDQLEQWPHSAPIDQLWGSLRSAAGVPCYRRCTANPPAPAWVKQRYIDPAPPLTPFTYAPVTDRPDLQIHAIFIPATLEDNPYAKNDPRYEARLAAVGDERRFQAWRYGRWDIMVGQVFEEWRADVHILDRFQKPPYWTQAGGMDWGYRAPGAFYLAACGPDGDVVIHREMAFREQTGLDVGRAIGWICREEGEIEYIAGDEQMWYKTGSSAPTIAEEVQNGIWEAYGDDRSRAPRLIEATHGRGSRLTKLQVLHRYLKWTQSHDGKVPPWGRPRLKFTRQCAYAIRTIPALPYDPRKPEDVDTSCFRGSERFLTPNGPVSFAAAEGTTGRAWTRVGWRPYTWCRKRNWPSAVVRVMFGDGQSIVCTPDHRFLTVEREWIAARDLQGRSCMTASAGGRIDRATTATAKASNSIGASGSERSAPSHRAMRFTTSTVTATTTNAPTFDASPARSIAVLSPAASIPPKPDQSASGVMSLANASYAGDSSSLVEQTVPEPITAPAFAGTAWEPNSVNTTPSVPSAARSFAKATRLALASPVDTCADGSYVVSVTPLKAPESVYCIHVPGIKEFALANGVIVHNSDDHAYDAVCALLMSRPPIPDKPERVPEPDEHPGLNRSGKRKRYETAFQPDEHWERPGSGYRVPRVEDLVPLEDGDFL